MKFDPVLFIEACYSAIPDEHAFARRLLETLESFDRGLGLIATAVSAREGCDGQVRLLAEAGAMALPLRGRVQASIEQMQGYAQPTVLPTSSKALLSIRREAPRWGNPCSRIEQLLSIFGAADALAVIGIGQEGSGLCAWVPYSAGRAPSPRMFHVLSRVVWHLGSGLHLRHYLAEERSLAPRVPTGEALEAKYGGAESSALARGPRGLLISRLREAKRVRERLRRLAPEETLLRSRELIEGGWSLVDHADVGGRKILLAVRGPADCADVRALTAPERAVLSLAAKGYSDKEIAYELRIAASTVAGHLRILKGKLGLTSRRALIELWAGLAISSSTDD